MNPTRPEREGDAVRAYVEMTALDRTTKQRVRERLDRGNGRPSVHAAPGWVLATAAVVSVAILWRVASPDPARTAAPIAAGTVPEHVTLRLDGEGTIAGTDLAPVIRWERGSIDLRVTPQCGVQLEVVTDEARIRVIGTSFRVARAHHATSVTVDEGSVEVACIGETEVRVTPGQQWMCRPADLTALLLRTAELAAANADPEERLRTVDRALPLATQTPVAHGELLAHRVRALDDAGRSDEALLAAEVYLEAGHTARRAELLGFVARTRFERDGCAAQPALERAIADVPAGPEALLLASCLTTREPDRARALVRAAAAVDGEWAALAERLRQALATGEPR